MKYPCEMIKDVMPLYYDKACSEETKQIVETHLAECYHARSIGDLSDCQFGDCSYIGLVLYCFERDGCRGFSYFGSASGSRKEAVMDFSGFYGQHTSFAVYL